MRRRPLRSRTPSATASTRSASARRLPSGLEILVTTVGAALMASSCSVDPRAVGVPSAGGAPGASGQGGSETPPSAGSGGGGALAGAGGDGDGTGGDSMRGGLGGDAGLGGAADSGAAGASGGASGSSGGADPDAGSVVEPEPELPSCASQRITGIGSATATTAAGAGQFSLTCSAGSADDVGIYWVAPEAGYYSIDTFGSTFDTALAIVPDTCSGELACNDDVGSEITSELVHEFAAGEAVVFVVDGESGSSGDVVLNTHAIRCPGIDLNLQAPPVDTTTLDGTNEHAGACGGGGELEKAFRWKAPSDGLFRFTAEAEGFAPALHVERGARCGGELIGCNAGGFRSPATVLARLAEGEVVTVIVDGVDGAGAVLLDVQDASAETCPDQPGFDPFDFVSGVLAGGDPSVLSGSCVPTRQVILPGGEYDLPEHSYPITIDGASCEVQIDADGPVAVYVQEGLQCGGRELLCAVVEDSSEEGFVEADLGSLTGPAFDYVVVVEAIDPNGPPVNYTLGFACAVF